MSDSQIAAEVDEHRGAAHLRHPLCRLINCVFLADAAEIDLHAGRQRDHRANPANLRPAHERKQCFDLGLRGQSFAAIEGPCLAQYPGRDVEQTIGQPMHQRREVEQVRGLAIDRDGLASR